MIKPQDHLLSTRCAEMAGNSGAAMNFVREGPITDVVRDQSLALFPERLCRCHSSISGLLQHVMTSNTFHHPASINFDKQILALAGIIIKQFLTKQF